MPKLRELTKDPPLARGDAENQLEEMRDYLIKVVEELKYQLENLDTDNLGDSVFRKIEGMIPSVPSAYTSNPEMDGTASPGSSEAWAKGDHVHPSDTSKANQAQLAYVEAGSTASRNYSAGEFFCWNGSLYQATAAISSGASFNSGSGGNCKSVYASDYSAGTWAPITTNATVIANAPERNGYARYGSLLVIYIALELKADLANLSQIDICDDVAGEMGVSSVLTPFANAPAFSVQRSAGSSDIILRVQYNSNKLTLINRSGTVASKTNRFIYGYIPLAVL